MTAPRSGWFADPVGRYRTRWWDGNNWRGWVDGDGSVERDPLPNAERPRVVVSETPRQARWRQWRRRIAITALVAAIASIPLGCFALLVNESDNEGELIAQRFVHEMDAWVLPDTVARADRPDDLSGGTFGASGPSATRYFVPQRGATAREAAADLVDALRVQGYHDLEPLRRGLSLGSCPTPLRCGVDIFVSDGVIEVTLD